MAKLLCIDVASLNPGDVTESAAPNLSRLMATGALVALEPPFPAVTLPVQATLTTGRSPAEHGIVANGFYRRDFEDVSFWEQSGRLVAGGSPRLWEAAREKRPGQRSAVLFWQLSLYAGADLVLSPKPIHTAAGEIWSVCYSRPPALFEGLRRKQGEFDLKTYWGPLASIASSQWIAGATMEVLARDEPPDLVLTYLPVLDYVHQKEAPKSAAARAELARLDQVLGTLFAAAARSGHAPVVLSEYAITEVSRPIYPNRALREAGLHADREVNGREYLDTGDSRAFAVVDHQVAHVYVRERTDLKAAKGVLLGLDGVEGEEPIAHARAGEIVLAAKRDAWFAYPWWQDDARAPDFARTVDIHRKPGYDPCELFFDPPTRGISLDAKRVKGSHGAVPRDPDQLATFACGGGPVKEALHGRRKLKAAEVYELLLEVATA